MTLPHQCRCVICGEVGVIRPALINPFVPSGEPVVIAQEYDLDYAGEERRLKLPIVPSETSSPYASSRADELAPREPPTYADVATCTHGYTRCMPCKFPAS